VRRSAQDDEFVGIWTKDIPSKLAVMKEAHLLYP